VPDVTARLQAARISVIAADLEKHHILERDGFIALVERTPDGGYGQAGTAGLLTEQGLAPLVWRGDAPVFVARGTEVAATAEQVDTLRSFQRDLETSLRE